jgi:hypothetical protein
MWKPSIDEIVDIDGRAGVWDRMRLEPLLSCLIKRCREHDVKTIMDAKKNNF